MVSVSPQRRICSGGLRSSATNWQGPFWATADIVVASQIEMATNASERTVWLGIIVAPYRCEFGVIRDLSRAGVVRPAVTIVALCAREKQSKPRFLPPHRRCDSAICADRRRRSTLTNEN